MLDFAIKTFTPILKITREKRWYISRTIIDLIMMFTPKSFSVLSGKKKRFFEKAMPFTFRKCQVTTRNHAKRICCQLVINFSFIPFTKNLKTRTLWGYNEQGRSNIYIDLEDRIWTTAVGCTRPTHSHHTHSLLILDAVSGAA